MENEKNTEYNGWKNYSTWNIALWFDHDEELYGHWIGVSKLLASQKGEGWQSGIAQYFAYTCFKDNRTPDGVEIGDPSIDWVEIANAWNENIKDYDWYAQIHE